ncbi:MAG: NGG1p interacting factor NIF3 [Nitrospirae bacterium]|nr:MAG: NGG1p interacting factor NIF3 [Nitrospirota bacterium]
MKLSEFYGKALSAAIENDPRGREFVEQELVRRKKDFDKLTAEEKEDFDRESLENPYADSKMLYGSGDEEIKRVLVGIDIDVSELLLAEGLRAKGLGVDLVLAHHPEGRAYANLYNVMNMQADILHRFGVPINTAEALMESRVKEVERKLMPANHSKTVDAAKLLNIPLMCLHTMADNMVATFLQQGFEDKKPYTLDDVISMLNEIPEYKVAKKESFGPRILIGSKNRKAGKVFVDMTGGTEGSKEIFSSLSLSGINTIVGMHLSEDHRKEAEKNNLNVVIAGHIASDNLGLNLLFDAISKGDDIEFLECSGFRRVSRK